MADGSLDPQTGARICNGLGILRAYFETQKLEQLASRMGEIEERTIAGIARPGQHVQTNYRPH